MPSPSLFDFLRDSESMRNVRQGVTDALNRGMVAGALGAPVDLATQAANLGVAGVGYAGHKLGLLSTPPDLIDSRNVPGSSEWIGQKMQNAGAVSANRNAPAEFAAGLLSMGAPKAAQKVGGLLAGAEMKAAENAAKPSTMRMQGQRGAVNIGGMTDDVSQKELEFAKQIHAQLSGAPGRKVGLRVLPPELGVPEVGASLEPSFKFVNGEQTQKRLAGVSAATLGNGSIQDVLQAVRNLGLFRDGPNGYYFGNKVALIHGSSRRKGEDIGEAVIVDPIVSYITDSPRAKK